MLLRCGKCPKCEARDRERQELVIRASEYLAVQRPDLAATDIPGLVQAMVDFADATGTPYREIKPGTIAIVTAQQVEALCEGQGATRH